MERVSKASVGLWGGSVMRRSLDFQSQILPPDSRLFWEGRRVTIFSADSLWKTSNAVYANTNNSGEKGEDDLKLVPVCNFEMSKTSLGAMWGG